MYSTSTVAQTRSQPEARTRSKNGPSLDLRTPSPNAPAPSSAPTSDVRASVDEGYWGYHLILDARGCDVAAITCKPTLDRFIRTLVRDIEMTAYGEPVIEHFATHDIEKAGYSLVQLIETSSITGHFVDKNGDAYIDVFSCKPYPIETVKALVQRFFQPKSMRVTYLTRQA